MCSGVLDVERTVASLIGNPGAPAHRVSFRRAAPDVTTDELAALRVHELVWEAAVLMKLDVTDTSITIRFYSSPLGRRVGTTTGTPYAWIGGTGFSVDYKRRVYAEERLLRDERFQTRYDPQSTVGAHLPNVEG